MPAGSSKRSKDGPGAERDGTGGALETGLHVPMLSGAT
jgi:hypothetical protein